MCHGVRWSSSQESQPSMDRKIDGWGRKVKSKVDRLAAVSGLASVALSSFCKYQCLTRQHPVRRGAGCWAVPLLPSAHRPAWFREWGRAVHQTPPD